MSKWLFERLISDKLLLIPYKTALQNLTVAYLVKDTLRLLCNKKAKFRVHKAPRPRN
jgi:hypothetical protein